VCDWGSSNPKWSKKDITKISEADAMDFRQYLMNSKLASATVAKRLQFARTFFHDARRRKLIASNPFAEVSAKSVVRLDQRRFITQQETTKLLDACPNQHWRTIITLARYGGLRCPSEVLSLRWQDIDWDRQRINVPSPKTEHHGKGSRLIPLFPELKVALEEAWELAPEGAIYVVDERYRKSSNASKGWRNCNLRTYFERIITRAGLEPWPKLFHALRSSRETELAQDFPIHVVTAWLGNTPTIAMRHYLLTTDADFRRGLRAGCWWQNPHRKSGADSGAAGPGNRLQRRAAGECKSRFSQGKRNVAPWCNVQKRRGQDSNFLMFPQCFLGSSNPTTLQHLDRSRNNAADYSKSKKGLSPWTV